MTFICYPRMGTTSRRAMRRRKWKGKIFRYFPRGSLLKRLQEDLKEIGFNWSIDKIYWQIKKERKQLLKEQGFDVKSWEV